MASPECKAPVEFNSRVTCRPQEVAALLLPVTAVWKSLIGRVMKRQQPESLAGTAQVSTPLNVDGGASS